MTASRREISFSGGGVTVGSRPGLGKTVDRRQRRAGLGCQHYGLRGPRLRLSLALEIVCLPSSRPDPLTSVILCSFSQGS
jgi:hypothetical protein